MSTKTTQSSGGFQGTPLAAPNQVTQSFTEWRGPKTLGYHGPTPNAGAMKVRRRAICLFADAEGQAAIVREVVPDAFWPRAVGRRNPGGIPPPGQALAGDVEPNAWYAAQAPIQIRG